MDADVRWMRSALTLARRGLGRTWPNPAVGCILVRNGRVLGRGATAPGGRPHAEATAIEMAKSRGHDLTGATAYVSLEPCAHHGRTPPCADALCQAGISRVVCPMTDPDPRVAGRGFARLRSAGIDVAVGTLALEARSLNAGFLSRIERSRPWVTLKLATTLDGRIATSGGESRWITGPEARRCVHLMRAESDAILVGSGTALADDPMLDVRDIGMAERSPVRIVADSTLSMPPTARMLQTTKTIPVWVAHGAGVDKDQAQRLQDAGAQLIECGGADGRVDHRALMTGLAERGITRLFCEGGARLAASMLSSDLADEIALFSAGRFFGADAVSAIDALAEPILAETPRFELFEIRSIGGDTLSIWNRPSSPP